MITWCRQNTGKACLAIACAVLICVVILATIQATAEAEKKDTGYRLTKATIVDNTSSAESQSQIPNTSEALLEGLSFVEKNPFFLNIRETLTSPYSFPLPTDSFVEKCEWKYNESGRVKSATMYKSSNELSSVQLSYDSHGSISKVIGWTTMKDAEGSSARESFEMSIVNEELSKGKYGANKFTVVHQDSSKNDTVLFTYDKDKNLNQVTSSGLHTWTIDVSYLTSLKVPKELKLSQDGEDKGEILVPTYDAKNMLTMLETGTWDESAKDLDGERYEIQYSGSRYSKMRVYDGNTELRYYEFKYDEHGNLSSIRVYAKGGSQLYNITFSWEPASH